MKLRLVLLLLILMHSIASAQIVTISPAGGTIDDEIKIVYDATIGSETGLIGADKVYMHSGVVLTNTANPTGDDWQNVVGNWGADDGIGEMTKVSGETDKWEITLSPSARDYYGLSADDNAFYLSMVFRNADGTSAGRGEDGDFGIGIVNGGDIFIRLDAGEFAIFNGLNESYFLEEAEKLTFEVETSNEASAITVSVEDPNAMVTELANEANTKTVAVEYIPAGDGIYKFSVEATINGEVVTASSSVDIKFIPATEVAAIPAGLVNGVNYSSDQTKVSLVLLAPEKDFVYVVGTMNEWSLNDDYLMKRDTENADLFWLEIDGLEAGKEYIYQYLVEGNVRIGDPYGRKVADPWNDEFIPDAVYPDLISFTNQDYGVATTFQTGQTPFVWDESESSWQRPDKQDLVIYELLVRDFIGSHSYQDLIDSIGYLKNLGVNAIELMPIMEFEGNISWGYNPSYFFAVDKYYGTENGLKEFIQVAHQNGIAVILDMVLNHAFGQSPMVRMFWDPSANTVTEDSPWFNQQAPHPFSVGYDFNHEKQYTRDFVDDVNRYWIEEFHFDGYRFDLSKGFTQQQSDEGSSSNFDQSRIDILTRMANKIWEFDDEAYIILEHFAASSEEDVLKEAGMMTWGNNNHDYRELLKGNTSPNITSAREDSRISYMESHDEERIAWEMKEFGPAEGDYDVSSPETYYERSMLGAAFFFTLPGPKMLWQFQELGYDIELNDDRLAIKPLPWGEGNLGYYEDENRKKIYEVYSAILGLRNDYATAFEDGLLVSSLNGAVKFIKLTHEDINMMIIGNFDTSESSVTVQFQSTGTWYDYLTGGELEISNATKKYDLLPGEFHIFTDEQLPLPGENLVSFDVTNQGVITDVEDDEAEGLLLYPTFTEDVLNLRIPMNMQADTQVLLTSMDGKEYQLPLTNRGGANQYEVSLSGLSDGVYILRYFSGQGVYQSKVIKK
ncbi:MAG: alpha-amylase family glycosyl hydrolase [Bacteroidota bacterium]